MNGCAPKPLKRSRSSWTAICVPANTLAFLINVIYFKGTWLTAFEVIETKPFSFYNHGQDDVEVAAMTLHQRLGYATVGELGARAVEVPYAGGRFRMTIVFTNSETGLSAVKSGLKASLVEKLANDTVLRDVQV